MQIDLHELFIRDSVTISPFWFHYFCPPAEWPFYIKNRVKIFFTNGLREKKKTKKQTNKKTENKQQNNNDKPTRQKNKKTKLN